MKFNFRFVLAVIVGVLVILACGAPSALLGNSEKGDITIVNPTDGTQFHDDDTGMGLVKALSITSTFQADKDATYYVNNLGPYGCRVLANLTTTCPVQLQTGENTIRVSVPKGNGVSESSVVVSWVPYAPMDKWMGSLAGFFNKDGSKFGNPMVGYGVVLVILLIAGVVAMAAVFGNFGAANMGGVVGFFMTLIIAAIYFNAAGNTILAGQVLTLIYSVIAVALTAFILYTMVSHGYMASTGGYVHFTDGERQISMGVGPQLGKGEHVSNPEKMSDAAARMLAELNGQRGHMLPGDSYPQITSGRPERRGLARLLRGK